MKITICFLAVTAAVLTGCGDHSTKPDPSTNAATGGVLTAPTEYVGAMAKAQQSAIKTIDTTSLKQAIQLFQADEGKLPKDLNELVEKKFLPKLPAAPAGMRLDYDPATGEIQVVKQ